MVRKDLRKAKDVVFGGAVALESAKLLRPTTLLQKTDIVGSMVGIGTVGVVSDIAFRLAVPKKMKRKRR